MSLEKADYIWCVDALNLADLLIQASLLMAYLLLVRTWQSVKRSLKRCRRALCSAPRGILSQAKLEDLEFYGKLGTCHGSKKLLQLLIMEPPLERSPYFSLA